mmetsp:Transcript_79948/g.203500  ORF Transcript_79948/g.203500 Transcript_79948/m.203500 type:complete len:213 (-) Transcript_79948:155-793(-)
MSPSKSSSHSCTTLSKKALCSAARWILASSQVRLCSYSCISFSTARISVSNLLHSAASSLVFLSPFSMLVSMSRRTCLFFSTWLRSSASLRSKCLSCSSQAFSRLSTFDRVACSACPACRSSLSLFRSWVSWFSSLRAAKMPRNLSNFLSSICLHSSLTSILQHFCMNFSTKAPEAGSLRATMAKALLGARSAGGASDALLGTRVRRDFLAE